MRSDEADGHSFASGAAGAADAVYVAFGIERDMVVKNMRHVADIEASGRYVGGDEDVCFAALERLDGLFTLALLHIAVQAFGVVALGV